MREKKTPEELISLRELKAKENKNSCNLIIGILRFGKDQQTAVKILTGEEIRSSI